MLIFFTKKCLQICTEGNIYNMNNYDIRKDFLILENQKIAYLDNANPHRGAYSLSIRSTEKYDEARKAVADFINAESERNIVFTRNTTESLNLIAYNYGMDNIKENDKIVLSIMEHHSNLVTWQNVAKTKKATLEYMYVNEEGIIPEKEIEEKIVPGVKIVGITQVSDVLGTINPVKKIIEKAHSVGAIVVVDGAQAVPHFKVDVQDLKADFYVFSGHKMLAPMGIGVLYGKMELLEKMRPFLYGGDMIEYVYEQDTTYAEVPTKFEAGTQNVEGAVRFKSCN